MNNQVRDKRGYSSDECLRRLLNPMDITKFFAEFWGQQPVKLETGTNFGSIFQSADIDSLLRLSGPTLRMVRQANGQTQTRDIPKIANAPDLYAVYRAWTEGFSIAIDEVLNWPGITEFRQQIEAATHYKTTTTAFLTPPGDQLLLPEQTRGYLPPSHKGSCINLDLCYRQTCNA